MELAKWNKICEMEQYLNYMLMTENHLATLMIFWSHLKTFIQRRQTYKTAERFSETYNEKEISNKQFHHCQANIFVEKVTKSINSQTNIKSSGNDSLTANFINTFQMNYIPSFNVYQWYPI